jgi:cytochrome c
MARPTRKLPITASLLLGLVLSPAALAQAVDEEAAERLAKKGDCFKCHAVARRKKAPAYVEIAEKYRNRPDAQRLLYLHITGEPVVKLAEGDEPHAPPPTKDDAELQNLIRWILSRERGK